MPTEVVRRLSPEGEELAARREELARLEAELADRELIVASLRAELAAFEGLYLRRVGFFTPNSTNGMLGSPNCAPNESVHLRRKRRQARHAPKPRNHFPQRTAKRPTSNRLGRLLN